MITGMLQNSTGTVQLPPFEVSLNTDTLENATDVTTLDFNLYTDFINSKRQWVMGWDSLTEDEYDSIREMYEEQFSLFEYPYLTISYYGIVDVPVRMYMNRKAVWNHCGEVENVEITLRETVQLPTGGSS